MATTVPIMAVALIGIVSKRIATEDNTATGMTVIFILMKDKAVFLTNKI